MGRRAALTPPESHNTATRACSHGSAPHAASHAAVHKHAQTQVNASNEQPQPATAIATHMSAVHDCPMPGSPPKPSALPPLLPPPHELATPRGVPVPCMGALGCDAQQVTQTHHRPCQAAPSRRFHLKSHWESQRFLFLAVNVQLQIGWCCAHAHKSSSSSHGRPTHTCQGHAQAWPCRRYAPGPWCPGPKGATRSCSCRTPSGTSSKSASQRRR